MLIQVGAESVAGAYALYAEGETPSLLATRRIPVEVHEKEPHERAVLRALDTLGNALLREGAPALLRASGSGRANTILVSVDTSWQKVGVRFERFERKEPFLFTKSMVTEALRETSTVSEGETLVDESVVSTVLNGYETRNPYGEMARHASVAVLSSYVDTRIAEGIIAILRGIYHTKKIRLIIGSSLRYQAMRRAFSHERDALIFDALGPLTSVALIHNNLLVAIVNELSEFAGEHSLPHTVFLLANESEMPALKQKFNTSKVVPVLASHLTGLVRQATVAPPDLPLSLMALYLKR